MNLVIVPVHLMKHDTGIVYLKAIKVLRHVVFSYLWAKVSERKMYIYIYMFANREIFQAHREIMHTYFRSNDF